MITVKLKGGLGNQLFQYAYGRSVSIKLETPLFLDVSGFKDHSETETPRKFQLGYFSLPATILEKTKDNKINTCVKLIEKTINSIKNALNPYGEYIFNPKNLEVKEGSYLEGFWQSAKYFSDIETILRHDLKPKEKLGSKAELFKNRIQQVESNGGVSASIHIRIGDRLTNKYANAYHGLLDITYYQKAISTLQARLCGKQLVLFIFSDDIAWVKENLKTEIPYVCISRPEILDQEEIFLMGYCSHNIISNSSFGWWGAWLNPKKDKIVVCPKKWVKDRRANTNDITPLDWVRV